jgi:hypothetical protein
LQSNSATKNSIALAPSSKDIWPDNGLPRAAHAPSDNAAQTLQRFDYTDLRKALLQINRPDALPAFQLHDLDDSAVDLADHEQHLEYLGLTTHENAQLMDVWQNLRGLGSAAVSAATASASRAQPVDVKVRSLASTSSSATALLPPRSVISPDASMLPVLSQPSLTMRSIADMAAAVCIKNSTERQVIDSDDENDAELMTTNSVQHLPAYIRAYYPQILSDLRVFHVGQPFVHAAATFASCFVHLSHCA